MVILGRQGSGKGTQSLRLAAQYGCVHLSTGDVLRAAVEEVTERMMARGREDDTEEAIARRLSLYEEQTAPLLDWFAERGLLATVDGLGGEDQVFSRLTEAIDGRMA